MIILLNLFWCLDEKIFKTPRWNILLFGFISVHLVKLFKDDGVSYFQSCSTVSGNVDNGGLIRIDFVAVDVDAKVAFKASLDAEMLSSAKELLQSDDVESWAMTAFTTSSTDFR